MTLNVHLEHRGDRIVTVIGGDVGDDDLVVELVSTIRVVANRGTVVLDLRDLTSLDVHRRRTLLGLVDSSVVVESWPADP